MKRFLPLLLILVACSSNSPTSTGGDSQYKDFTNVPALPSHWRANDSVAYAFIYIKGCSEDAIVQVDGKRELVFDYIQGNLKDTWKVNQWHVLGPDEWPTTGVHTVTVSSKDASGKPVSWTISKVWPNIDTLVFRCQ